MLPKQILTNYKYENGHTGLCMFDFGIRKIWNGQFAAYYINQSRGDDYPRYLIAFIGNSEKIVTNKIEKWVSKHLTTFKYYEHKKKLKSQYQRDMRLTKKIVHLSVSSSRRKD